MQQKTLKYAGRVACGLVLTSLTASVLIAQEAFPGADPATTQPVGAESGFTTTETGLRYRITSPAGEPKVAQEGDVLCVHYTGRLADGTVFDTSLRPRPSGHRMLVQPFNFKLGEGAVIPGWEQGLEGMKVGEKRTLIIPPSLAYGETGAGNVIPPNATLTFDVELIGLWRPETAEPAAPDTTEDAAEEEGEAAAAKPSEQSAAPADDEQPAETQPAATQPATQPS